MIMKFFKSTLNINFFREKGGRYLLAIHAMITHPPIIETVL